jgi:signal transduction histidine kinase
VTGAGNVDVEVVTAADGGSIQIIVSDDGPGISAEDKDKLFLPYFSTKTNGMGLGLPIVSEIAIEHGGTIRAEDNVPRGSRFIFDLPVVRAAVPLEVQV